MVRFKNNDKLDDILFKLLLVITEHKKIEYIENIKSRFVNESNFSMGDKEDYKILIEKLKKYEYIDKEDKIEIIIHSSTQIFEKDKSKYYFKLNFTQDGIPNLTKKGEKFIKEKKSLKNINYNN